MKKISLMLTLVIMMVGSAVFAGNIDYLSNQSAKYDMNTARTASVDGADTAAYNPAGTAFMGEGLFIDFSTQTVFKYYKQDAEIKASSLSESYEQSKPTPVLPNLSVVYNFGQVGIGKLAVYAGANIVAGGGALLWNGIAGGLGYDKQVADTMNTNSAATAAGMATAGWPAALMGNLGLGTTTPTGTDVELKGSAVYYGVGAGAAYSLIEDMLSVSAGARYVISEKSTALHGKLFFSQTGGTNYSVATGQTTAQDYSTSGGQWEVHAKSINESEAKGYTVIVGTDVKPVKELTIGVRYETETVLNYKFTQTLNSVSNTFNSALNAPITGTGDAKDNANINAGLNASLAAMLDKDGIEHKANLPQIVSIGAEYLVMPDLTVGLTSNMYFLGQTDLSAYGKDYQKNFGTSYEVALGVSYKVMEPLKLNATVMYSDQAAKDSLYTDDVNLLTVSGNPVMNSIFTGIGGTYTVMPGLDLSLSLSWVHYLPKDIKTDAGIEASYKKEVYTVGLGVGYKI